MPTRRALLAAAALAPLAAVAQDYPARPVRIVLAYPPGGSTDVLARVLAARLQEMWNGSAVVVENRPGGGAIVGTQAVAMAAPDGYTLALGNNQTHASNQWMARDLPYHVIDSFTPVAKLAVVHHAVVVPANHPAKTLAELIERGRNGGRLTYASSSVGSASHVIAESFARHFKLDATHVPYRGGGQATTDTVAGVVDFFVSTWPQVVALVRDGKLRALAIGAPARLPEAPDVPTVAEAGAPFMAVDAWFGMWGPAGTPRPIVDKLGAAFVAMLAEPAIVEKLKQTGFTPAPAGPDAFAAFQKEEVQRWKELAETTGIRME